MEPEKVRFTACYLRPEWFSGTDGVQHFRFIAVYWDNRGLKTALDNLRPRTTSYYMHHDFMRRGFSESYEMLSAIYQRLAVNAEENQRYTEASRFRYASLDTQRKASWHGFGVFQVRWWYWLASGYGERAVRALAVLVLIWVSFGTVYANFDDKSWKSTSDSVEENAAKTDRPWTALSFPRALIYSFEVLALQKPTPRPASIPAHVAVGIEGVLGPVQAALLALAVRRKVSRS